MSIFLELDDYTHITSPIRRLVDLLNIIELQDGLNICKKSKQSKVFYDEWTTDKSFEYIGLLKSTEVESLLSKELITSNNRAASLTFLVIGPA